MPVRDEDGVRLGHGRQRRCPPQVSDAAPQERVGQQPNTVELHVNRAVPDVLDPCHVPIVGRE
jgi:hypothetical protein